MPGEVRASHVPRGYTVGISLSPGETPGELGASGRQVGMNSGGDVGISRAADFPPDTKRPRRVLLRGWRVLAEQVLQEPLERVVGGTEARPTRGDPALRVEQDRRGQSAYRSEG